MAPSGENNIPERFRQRPSPTFSSPNTESKETQKHWENLLDRRKKCKDRYSHIKKELDDASASLVRLDQKSMAQNTVIKLGPLSFIPKVSSDDKRVSATGPSRFASTDSWKKRAGENEAKKKIEEQKQHEGSRLRSMLTFTTAKNASNSRISVVDKTIEECS